MRTAALANSSSGRFRQPQLVGEEDAWRPGKPEPGRVIGAEQTFHAGAYRDHNLIERSPLCDDRDLEALRDIPGNVAGNDHVRGVADRARSFARDDVLAGARVGGAGRRKVPIRSQHLVDSSSDPREVRPPVRVVRRRIHTQPAAHMGANRCRVKVRQRAYDLFRTKLPTVPIAADRDRGAKHFLVNRHVLNIHR